jgi:hypothetical protein
MNKVKMHLIVYESFGAYDGLALGAITYARCLKAYGLLKGVERP